MISDFLKERYKHEIFHRERSWIAVDFDYTLRDMKTDLPIEPMMELVRYWLGLNVRVKIFTAMAIANDPDRIRKVVAWLTKNGLCLEVTNVKTYGMQELWDDRAVRTIFNKGIPCCDRFRQLTDADTDNLLKVYNEKLE